MYACVFDQVAVTAIQDLFELISASTAVTVIHELSISQSSDAGDTESEQLNVLMHRGTATGTGGTTVTPSPMSVGDSAYGGTVEANNTTQSVEGTLIRSESFNVMNGLSVIWTPEQRPIISPSGLFIVELQIAPADELTMSGTLIIEELGT
jgi:hypothetical protein